VELTSELVNNELAQW